MAHEPDTDSKGIYQCTSRISACVLEDESAMITSYCVDTSKPKCYLVRDKFPTPSVGEFDFKGSHWITPGLGRILTTYTGNVENGRLMPRIDSPIEIKLNGRNAQEIAEELRAAMNPDHFLAVACMAFGEKPAIINKED
jgi:hypothetical protein